MMRKLLIGMAGLAVMAAATLANAADIRTVPGDNIILNPVNPDKGYADLVIHSVVVATGPTERATIETLRVDVMKGDETLLSQTIRAAQLVDGAKRMGGAPIVDFVTGQLLNPKGLDGVFGRKVTFAQSENLAPSQAVLATGLHYSMHDAPDSVRFVATLRGDQGNVKTASTQLSVAPYTPAIAYRAPLDGTWLMQAIPTAESHHRFNPSTEFAVDFFKLGPKYHIRKSANADAAGYYGYGAPVHAAADGVIAFVIADQVQDRAALMPKPDEDRRAFGMRMQNYQMQRMAKNFRAANAGNIVTIKHTQNGKTEYTSYGHLKAGSVHVKPGDPVKQGAVIGMVGDTGDTPIVHLHFQVNAEPDAFTSKSLPAVFTDLKSIDHNNQLGRLVTNAAP